MGMRCWRYARSFATNQVAIHKQRDTHIRMSLRWKLLIKTEPKLIESVLKVIDAQPRISRHKGR